MNISSAHQKIIDDLKQQYPDDILEVTENRGDVLVRVSVDAIHNICQRLYDEYRFIYLVDIFGTDRFTSEDRFEVIYNIVSLRDQLRLFIKVRCEEEDPHVQTVTDIWKAANWQERQTYDMFGVIFDGHPDLRRVFLPEDFEYYPLRKEFPLLGVPGSIELPSTTPDTED
ncbi:MAG TPA: NADH-quinone oxidoreductase subunit C [Balneolales bacterium]|nr:NADH-quinone oxidoreductase subunit C [Balneolales bacterium]